MKPRSSGRPRPGGRDILRAGELLVVRGDRDGQLTYVNDALSAFFGRSAEELTGSVHLHLMAEPDRDGSLDRLHAVGGGSIAVAEVWLTDGVGRRRCVQWVSSPERGPAGEVVGYQSIGRDITPLVEVRDAMLAQKTPPEGAEDLLFLVDAAGRFLAYHAGAGHPLLLPPDVFLGTTIEAVLPPELAARGRAALGSTLAVGSREAFDFTLERDGQRHAYRAHALRIDAEHALFVGRWREDADRREADDDTRELLAAMPDLVLRATVDDEGAVALEPVGEAAGSLAEFIKLARTVRTALEELVRRAVRTGDPQTLHEFQSTKGDKHETYEARVARSGERSAVCFIRNIGERRQQLVAMMEADRVRAISTLVAGVGHQINNPLSYVVGNLDFLRAELDDARDTLQDSLDAGSRSDDGSETMGVAMAAKQALDAFESISDALADIDEGVRRISGIVHDLRVFNQEDQELAPIDVCAVLDEAIAIADNEIRHRARLTRRYDGPSYVFGNAGRLRQLFFNVLANAANAIHEGAAASNDITVAVTRDSDEWVSIVISDSGRGMPPDVAEHVFDPFFTTKPVGEGSGLGLAVCREIARLHGGTLTLDSEQHIGTDVTVRLCAAAEPPQDEARGDGGARALPHPTAGEIAQVLLIDDEPGVGRVVPRMLGDAAHVTFFPTARAALDEIERGAQFDLVLCDLMMPEMTGMQFYQRLVDAGHELAQRVVFVTGGAFTHAAQTFLDEVELPVLYKPFDVADLHALLANTPRRA